MSAKCDPKLAIFIDCENASSRLLARLLNDMPYLGRASIKRAYGTPDKLKSWKEFSRKNRFDERPTTSTAKRKNATDFAMVIDCIHLLHTSHFQEAWLVTSDADFVQLAKHLVAHGTRVVSVGKNDTPKSLRKACDDFVNYSINPRSATNSMTRPAVTVIERAVAIYKSFEKPTGVKLSVLGKALKDGLGDQIKGYGGLSGFLKIAGPFSVKGQTAYLIGSEGNITLPT